MLPNQASSENTKDNNKIITLAIASAVMSIVFSFMSAPFIRVLASTRSKFFWMVGIVFVSMLFFLKMNLVAIYVGAVWMTLGLYSELEKKGINWRKSSVISVLSGVAFGVVSFLFITKSSLDSDLAKQVAEPLMLSLKQMLPDKNFETKAVMMYMPGLFGASLIGAIAASLAFESQIFQVFKLKREKLASGLKWLEFRLPDLFIWVSLFSLLFSIVETPIKFLQVIAINISVASVVAYFFQGISVFEFSTRLYKVGKISKLLLYVLIVAWALPFIAILGFADYWVDFRRHMRTRLKAG